jgi:hypothetical protein
MLNINMRRKETAEMHFLRVGARYKMINHTCNEKISEELE